MTTLTPKLLLKKFADGEKGWQDGWRENLDMIDAIFGAIKDQTALSGTATIGTTSTLSDTSLAMGVDAMKGASIIVRRGNQVLRVETVLSNTASAFTFATGVPIQLGDSYIVANQAVLPPAMPTLASLGGEPADPAIQTHLQSTHAPVGAQANRAIATKAQAEAGTNNTTDMTPLRVADAIAKSNVANNVTFLSKSSGNVFSILMNGKLYNAHANAGTWTHPTGRTSDIDYATEFGVKHGLSQVPFPNELSTAKIIQIGDTAASSFALFDSGNLYTWGYNLSGQLGLGDAVNRWLPTLSSTGVSEVFDSTHIGYSQTQIRYFIKKTDGTIWVCGHNLNGACGVGTNVNITAWTQVTTLGVNTVKVFNMGADAGCAFALKTDGTIWACGYNIYGNLGTGDLVSKSGFVDVTTAWGGNAADITVVGAHSYYVAPTIDHRCSTAMLRVDANGAYAMYTCGNSTWGARGDNSVVNTATVPYLIPNSASFREIAMFGGAVATLNVRTVTNDLIAWGFNTYGQVGSGNVIQQNAPVTVVTGLCAKLLSNGNDATTHGHYMQSFYIGTDGNLYGAGWNTFAELGVGDVVHKNVHTRVLLPTDAGAVTDLGWFTSTGTTKNYIAKTASGKLFTWGYGGQQGIAMHTAHVHTPTQVQLPR